MRREVTAPSPQRNRLLAGLPRASSERLFRHLSLIRIARGSPIGDGMEGADAAYFPVGLVAGLISPREGGHPVCAATVGSEGVIGGQRVLPSLHPSRDAVALVEGFCYRLSGRRIRHDYALGGTLWSRLRQYEQGLLNEIERNLRCADSHSQQQRLSNALLEVFDRSPYKTLHMTLEDLCRLLDIPRGDLRAAAAALETRHAIHWCRGRIQLRHRSTLRAASCSCYSRRVS